MLEELREVAGLGGPAASLANDLLSFHQQLQDGELTQEEYQFLVNEIAEIRAQQELADDEQMCRWIVSAATLLVSAV